MEQIVINSTEAPATGPNDAALAAAGEAAVNAGNTHGNSEPVAKQRPDYVPEKFWNAETGEIDTEGLAKSYAELERGQSQKTQEQAKPVQLETVEQAIQLAKDKGIDFNALEQEYLANGDLTAETYKSLADKGIPEEQVKAFVNGQKASAQLQRTELLKDVGGDEGYAEIVSWAKESVSKEDIAAYNRAMSSNDKGVMQLAIQALAARYRAANGSPPKSQLGGKTSGSATSAAPFESKEQYVDAIKDARYDRDPAYRAQVMKRLQASNIF